MKINLDTDKILARVKTSQIFSMQNFLDFITFKSMVLPKLIVIIYLLATLACVCIGLHCIANENVTGGLLAIILGPLVVHLFLEMVMLPFAILDTLLQVRNEVQAINAKINPEE